MFPSGSCSMVPAQLQQLLQDGCHRTSRAAPCPQALAFLTPANSLCKKPWAQPLPGVEPHQHAQGPDALPRLSQPPPKIGPVYPAIPMAVYSLPNLCSCSLPNDCTQCLQDLACLLFIYSPGHQLAALSFLPSYLGPSETG